MTELLSAEQRKANARRGALFISFKSEERDVARRLAETLKSCGYRVWWHEEIQCSQEWRAEIDVALETAERIIVLWSPRAVQSPWVKHEASYALARKRYSPIMIEQAPIPDPYGHRQAVDLIGWDGDPGHRGFEHLLAHLQATMTADARRLRRQLALVSLVVLLALFTVSGVLSFWRMREASTELRAMGERVGTLETATKRTAGLLEDVWAFANETKGMLTHTLQHVDSAIVIAGIKIEATNTQFTNFIQELNRSKDPPLFVAGRARVYRQLPTTTLEDNRDYQRAVQDFTATLEIEPRSLDGQVLPMERFSFGPASASTQLGYAVESDALTIVVVYPIDATKWPSRLWYEDDVQRAGARACLFVDGSGYNVQRLQADLHVTAVELATPHRAFFLQQPSPAVNRGVTALPRTACNDEGLWSAVEGAEPSYDSRRNGDIFGSEWRSWWDVEFSRTDHH